MGRMPLYFYPGKHQVRAIRGGSTTSRMNGFPVPEGMCVYAVKGAAEGIPT